MNAVVAKVAASARTFDAQPKTLPPLWQCPENP
jgi:hypothetical protein